jgi:uncharacterized protein CbrC (UPF0167 family)
MTPASSNIPARRRYQLLERTPGNSSGQKKFWLCLNSAVNSLGHAGMAEFPSLDLLPEFRHTDET